MEYESQIIENTFLFLGDQSTASVSVWLLSVSLFIWVDKYKSVLSVVCRIGLCLQYNHNITPLMSRRIAELVTVISLQANVCRELDWLYSPNCNWNTGTLAGLANIILNIIFFYKPKKETKLTFNWENSPSWHVRKVPSDVEYLSYHVLFGQTSAERSRGSCHRPSKGSRHWWQSIPHLLH